MENKFSGWVVFAITILAYVTVIAGAITHPSENNLATWIIWFFLASAFLYAQVKEGHSGWHMPLAWVVGNMFLVTISLVTGGYTFNLGPTESIALFGFTGAIAIWTAVGITTRTWSPRLLYWGAILADLASFYPLWKQYLGPHEPISTLGLFGWMCFFVGALINIVFVERCFHKLRIPQEQFLREYKKEKRPLVILEESLLSIEVMLSVGFTLLIMIY